MPSNYRAEQLQDRAAAAKLATVAAAAVAAREEAAEEPGGGGAAGARRRLKRTVTVVDASFSEAAEQDFGRRFYTISDGKGRTGAIATDCSHMIESFKAGPKHSALDADGFPFAGGAPTIAEQVTTDKAIERHIGSYRNPYHVGAIILSKVAL